MILFFTVLWFMTSSSSPSLQCEAVISGICKWGYVTLRHGHSFCHKIFSWKTWSNRLCGLLSMTCVVASDFHDHVSRSGSYGTQQGHRHMSWEVVEDPKKFEHAGFQSGWCKAALVFFHSCVCVYIYFFNLTLIYTGIPIETQYLIYRRNLFWTNNYHTKGKKQLFSGI